MVARYRAVYAHSCCYLLGLLVLVDGAAVICENHTGLFARRDGPCPDQTTNIRIAGANIFDSLWVGSSGMNTCCNPSGGPATYPDALAAMESAARSGVRVFRVFGKLFGTAQTMWVTNASVFWQEYDRMVDDIERLNLRAVLSIGTGQWHLVANALHPGLNETANDCVRNRSSMSYSLQSQYFHDIVTRYRGRPGILAWELGNELNLQTNLPPPFCGDKQCFNTSEMVAFTQDLCKIIRALDPNRPISSGFSMPRPSAWHQEHCPLTGPCPADPHSGYWTTDTEEQFRENLRIQNTAVDWWSVHLYKHRDKHGCYFDKKSCVRGGAVVTIAAEEAASSRKALYVGEYGGPHPNYTGPTSYDQEFPSQILKVQVSQPIPLTTIWAWACPSHRGDMVCIWPNSTRPKERGSKRMIDLLAEANARMNQTVAGTLGENIPKRSTARND